MSSLETVAAPAPPIRVLNVDDNEASLYAKTKILRRAGFVVAEAATGRGALEQVNVFRPDLVLLDVKLPDLSGIEVCRMIKSNPLTASIIVVQVSASFIERRDRVRGLDAGADAYLTEPLHSEELIANVSALLRLRKAEQEVQRIAEEWQHTFDAVQEGVALVSSEGTVIRANEAMRDLTGGHLDVLASWVRDAAGEDPLRERVSREMVIGERTLRMTVDPMRSPGLESQLVCTLSDITERKRFEEALRAARDEAEAASRAKDEFLATVSHELRTPMTAVMGWAKLLAMHTGDQPTVAAAAEAIERSARAQNDLVDDLLDISRIITGKLRLQMDTVELRPLIEESIRSVVPSAEARQISLTADLDDVTVRGDANRLRQVVWNLLSNSVKFTEREGRVEVSLRREGGDALLTVRDTGIGIAPEFLPFVFERFRQADSSATRSHGGLGIGLSIVRQLVEMHGGKVGVTSAGAGKGSSFHVTLPAIADAIAAAPAVEQQEPVRILEGARILVVEDAADTREVVDRALRVFGATVFIAGSVAEAMAILPTAAPDVLISDIAMPHEDGFALLKRVREHEQSRGMPPMLAVAMSAYQTRNRPDPSQPQFDAFVPKPLDPTQLAHVIADLRRAPLRPR